MGADVVLDYKEVDVVSRSETVDRSAARMWRSRRSARRKHSSNALRCLRPGGTLSSLGVYSGKLQIPYDAFAAGIGDHRIVTTLCPGGKERMRRLMEVVRRGRVDFTPLLTHRFSLDKITQAYRTLGERRDGVIKVAIRP